MNTNVDGLQEKLKTEQRANHRLEQQIVGVNGLDDQLSAKNTAVANAEATSQNLTAENERLSKVLGEVNGHNELLKQRSAQVTDSLRTATESHQRSTKPVGDGQKERDHLKAEVQNFRVVVLPENEITINSLKSEVC